MVKLRAPQNFSRSCVNAIDTHTHRNIPKSLTRPKIIRTHKMKKYRTVFLYTRISSKSYLIGVHIKTTLEHLESTTVVFFFLHFRSKFFISIQIKIFIKTSFLIFFILSNLSNLIKLFLKIYIHGSTVSLIVFGRHKNIKI